MNNKVRVLIVEDEFITLDSLRDALEESGYEISGDAMKAEEALAILGRGDTDIAILDIRLKGDKSGIWLAKQINETFKIPFIFLSAFGDPQTIKEASQTEPYAYLVKPFTAVDIYAAIEVALKNYAKKNEQFQLPKSHTEAVDELLLNDFIFIKENTSFRRIAISDIIFVQAFKNYLELVFPENRHIIRSTLKDFMMLLPKEHFIQTHRSYVVNIRRILRIGNSELDLGKTSIPISNTYKEAVLKKLNLFS
jgi:DNA-binding LytR/AlgR family response regulator